MILIIGKLASLNFTFLFSHYNISQDNNTNLTIQYHIKGVVHTKDITIPLGHYDPDSYVKEVNKEIKKIKHKFTEISEPKVLFKGRLKYNVRGNLAMHCSVTHFIIWQPI